ncbi:MAG: hypothetical protein ACHQF2_03290, partial [Flavobacteriales bacterium]
MTLARYHIYVYARGGVLFFLFALIFSLRISESVVKTNPEISFLITRAKSTSSKIKKPVVAESKHSEIPESWVHHIEGQIELQEYYVSFDKITGAFQSPNRKHNLRAYYTPGKFRLKSRKDTGNQPWDLSLTNLGVYVDDTLFLLPNECATSITGHDSIRFLHTGFTEEYCNNSSVIRQ